MVEELGRGIYLDQQLDFDITNTGDIRMTTTGSKELQKDIAFQLKLILQPYLGSRLRPNTKSEIKSDTISTLLSDNRVESVDRSSISIRETGLNSLAVSAVANTRDGQQELVFRI